jgi:hypothetical protein
MGITLNEPGERISLDQLNAYMEFDHVIEVLPTGLVRPRADIYAPSVCGEDGIEDDAWQPLKGYSSQGSGIINQAENWHMHDCESVGGQLARDILAPPGIYVAVWITWDPGTCDEDADEYGEEPTIEGWCVLFQEA